MKYFTEDSIEKIRRGYYTAVYFNRTKDILLRENNFKTVTMQVFQRNDGAILCGVEEVRELLKEATGYFSSNPKYEYRNSKQIPNTNDLNPKWINKSDTLKIESLRDGDVVGVKEPVMHITGPYAYFAQLESIYLGILARRTLVATNTRKAVKAAKGKPVIFFADRFDYFLNQEGDGYAAHKGEAAGVCTQAHTGWWSGVPSGTIPHALIAVNNGDTVKAAEQFVKYYPEEKLIVLVDYENDCIKTSLEVAKRTGKKLWGVRIDTAHDMVDRSLKVQCSKFKVQNYKRDDFNGVNPALVKTVRKALDSNGYNHVKIVVSGGFDGEKISRFEKDHVPVDVYGVGSALLKGNNDFTADVVMVEGKPMGKAGRLYSVLQKHTI